MFQKAASILPNKRDCLKEIIHLPCNLDGRELAARSGFVMGQPLLLWAETQAGRSGMNFHRVLIGWKASPALPPLCGLLTSWVLTTARLHLLWLIRSCFFFSEGARKEGQKPKRLHGRAPSHGCRRLRYSPPAWIQGRLLSFPLTLPDTWLSPITCVTDLEKRQSVITLEITPGFSSTGRRENSFK